MLLLCLKIGVRLIENKLINLNSESLTLDSREVAKIVGKEHDKLLRDIRNYISQMKQANKESPSLESPINSSDYFIESTYVNRQNKKQPCYEITKLGCEFVANKLTGVKGTAFTAIYIKRFNQMEQSFKNNQLVLANKEIQELKDTVIEFKSLTEEAKQQYKPSHKRKLDYNKMIKSLTNNDEEVHIVKDWVFGLLQISKWEDTCIEDSKKIIETIVTVSRLLTIKKFEQLNLF